ncbi:hypothetical protein MPH_01698 [Macrophomina phaseolina MS6]|uniref:Hydrophobin 2 n=1 Tax=Macrophomina phaseolina (strain MS6) TaxID=1126212 RepID=K2S1W4_MACPH|nr:hypothetical protein MPH_01698 [Macrophomina phaseolina MS6]
MRFTIIALIPSLLVMANPIADSAADNPPAGVAPMDIGESDIMVPGLHCGFTRLENCAAGIGFLGANCLFAALLKNPRQLTFCLSQLSANQKSSFPDCFCCIGESQYCH